MTITSKQKKTVLPLLIFIASCFWFAWLLGGPWFFLAIPSMIGSAMIMTAYNIDAWVEAGRSWCGRDGWK
ncbi:hypothetical protein [Pseudomonas syringae]|uniref:hypothetical protein n=1 Tax=Pseudomonas syringae TaxID=317 RepID=UPI00128ED311|nr:hypothetical protein [Pseudomonas syringae]